MTAAPVSVTDLAPPDLVGLDLVLALEPGKSATALRNIPSTLSIFDSHFPRFPVFPGVLILGSMAELAALLLHRSTARPWRLAGATRVRYRHFVQPGDQLQVTVELKDQRADHSVLRATARVDGKVVTTVAELRLRPDESGEGAA